jgi:hypothetical protein
VPPDPRDVIFTRDRRPAHSLKWKSARGGDGTTPEGGTSRSRSSAAPRWPLGTLWARSGHETPQRIVDRRPRYPLTRWFIVSSRAYRPQHANACAHSPQKWPLTRTFCGARWNRTIGLSIIRAGQRAGQAIGIPCGLPFRATVSHQETARATSFGHALGTAGRDQGAAPRRFVDPATPVERQGPGART